MAVADQHPFEAIRLASPQRILEVVRGKPGLSNRSTALLDAIRWALPTDPTATATERLGQMRDRLAAGVSRLNIHRRTRSAGTTTPELDRMHASDQYFLIERDPDLESDPVEQLLEALIVSTANLISDRLDRGTTLNDLESFYMTYPLFAVAGLVGESLTATKQQSATPPSEHSHE